MSKGNRDEEQFEVVRAGNDIEYTYSLQCDTVAAEVTQGKIA